MSRQFSVGWSNDSFFWIYRPFRYCPVGNRCPVDLRSVDAICDVQCHHRGASMEGTSDRCLRSCRDVAFGCICPALHLVLSQEFQENTKREWRFKEREQRSAWN